MEWWVIECFESSANFRINIPPPFYSSCSWCSDDLATSNTEKHVSLLYHKNRPHLQLPPTSSSTKTKIMFSKLREEKNLKVSLPLVICRSYDPSITSMPTATSNTVFSTRLFFHSLSLNEVWLITCKFYVTILFWYCMEQAETCITNWKVEVFFSTLSGFLSISNNF